MSSFHCTKLIFDNKCVAIEKSNKRIPHGLYFLFISLDNFFGVAKKNIYNSKTFHKNTCLKGKKLTGAF
jgi:hypothetical protein